MSEEVEYKDYIDDWNEIRDGLYHKVEHLMMQYTDGDILIIECPECHHQIPHQISRYNAVYRIVDLIIEQMNAYQVKTAKQMIGRYKQVRSSSVVEREVRPLEKVLIDLARQRVLTPSDCRKLLA